MNHARTYLLQHTRFYICTDTRTTKHPALCAIDEHTHTCAREHFAVVRAIANLTHTNTHTRTYNSRQSSAAGGAGECASTTVLLEHSSRRVHRSQQDGRDLFVALTYTTDTKRNYHPKHWIEVETAGRDSGHTSIDIRREVYTFPKTSTCSLCLFH